MNFHYKRCFTSKFTSTFIFISKYTNFLKLIFDSQNQNQHQFENLKKEIDDFAEK